MSSPVLELMGRFPWSAGAVLSLALVFALGLWLAEDRRTLAHERGAAVARLQVELRQMELVPVRWSMETLAIRERDAGRVEESIGRWRESLAGEFPGGGVGAMAVPRDRSEAYFSLDGFRGRMRSLAAARGVGLRAGESFGFAAYLHEGPDERFLDAVHQQRVLIEYLLTALFRETPIEIRNVQRERPVAAGRGETPAGTKTATVAVGADDFFAIDPRISARVPGLIDGTAVRLAFVGQTDTLRGFLAGLGGFGVPLIVRSVEVEEAGPMKTGVQASGDEDDFSQFTVIVEHVRLANGSPEASEAPRSKTR